MSIAMNGWIYRSCRSAMASLCCAAGACESEWDLYTSLPCGSEHMFPGARSSPADHVKRPRANPGAQNVQARIVIPVDDQAAGRTRMRAYGERLRNELTTA